MNDDMLAQLLRAQQQTRNWLQQTERLLLSAEKHIEPTTGLYVPPEMIAEV